MKRLTRLSGLYAKISQKVSRRVLFAGSVLTLCILCFALILYNTQDTTPRHYLETTGSEINFDAPGIVAHTADDGIAVIGASRPTDSPAQSARLTADPATIWNGASAPAHTHSGFTLPVQMDGEAIGVLTIPDIGLSVRVYEGEDYMSLMDRGSWHFPHTSAWYGNTAISAHNVNLNNTPGFFLNLYRLQPGAVIQYQTAFGVREYAVQTIAEICQYDWSYLGRTEDNRITLITCISGQAHLRLVVQAVEIENEE